MKNRAILLFIVIFISCFAEAKQITGKVIKVSDGDSFTILTDDKIQMRVRLFGVDAPEKGQDYGAKARTFVNELIYGKTVTIESKGNDKYKRLLGIVTVGKINVNEALLSNGLAWHYKHFYKSDRYAELQEQAKEKRLNIWSRNDYTPPWEYRKKPKSKV